MQIEIHRKEHCSLVEFADKHGLVMEIIEGPDLDYPYHAAFKGTGVHESGCCVNVCGQGATPLAALESYRRKISGKRLVINPLDLPKRYEIAIPVLTSLGVGHDELE
jgi:hypothetical protein